MQEIIQTKTTSKEIKIPIYADNRFPHLLLRHSQNEHGKLFPFFNSGWDLNKMCDYIVFAETKETLFVLLIELKGENTSLLQLDAAEQFVQFVFESCKRVKTPIEKEIKYCKVKIKNFKTATHRTKNDFKPDNGITPYPFSEFRVAHFLDAQIF